jgi:hypothetical protein
LVATTSGATRAVSMKVAVTGEYSVNTSCSIALDTLDVFCWTSPGDVAGYHGPDAVDGGCLDQGSPPDDPGVIACFDNVFYIVDLFGLAPVPWVHLTNLPGGMLCFIKRLFIPSTQQIAATFDNVQASWDASPLAPIGTLVASPFNAGSAFLGAVSDGDCNGPAVDVPIGVGSTVHPFAACSAPMSVAAGVVRNGLLVMFLLTAAFTCARLIALGLGIKLGSNLGQSGGDE